MYTKNPPHPFSLLFIASLFFIATGVFDMVSAIGPSATSVKRIPFTKSTSTVIARTSDVEALQSLANRKNIEVEETTVSPEGEGYVVLEGKTSDSDIKALAKTADEIIDGSVTPNQRYRASLTPNDTFFMNQWNLTTIKAPQSWDVSTGSSAVTIAVIDTGTLFSQQWGARGPYAHADFPSSKQWTNEAELGETLSEGAVPNCTSRSLALDKSCNNLDDDDNGFIDDWQGWDFMGGWRGSGSSCPNYQDSSLYADPYYPTYLTQDNNPQPYSCDDYTNESLVNKDHYSGGCGYGIGACVLSHGTSVASIAAATSNNSSHITGVDWNAKIMNLRALDGYGSGSTLSIAAAIDYATLMDADVINLSLALSLPDGSCTYIDPTIDAALQRAATAGIVIAAAAGNNGQNGVCYPARSPNVLAVGATTILDQRSSFSTYGSELDVVAPGSAVPIAIAPSNAQDITYSSQGYGTSFAAPHVAGLAANLIAANPSLSRQAIFDRIIFTASKPAGMNGAAFTTQYGFGRIDAYAALSNTPSIAVPLYTALSTPKYYWLGTATQKSDVRTGLKVGSTIDKGRVIRFYSKVYSGGIWYFRAYSDTLYNRPYGLPSSVLRTLPKYYKLTQPTYKTLKTTLRKTHLLLGTKSGTTLPSGRKLLIVSKTYVGGRWYYRTNHDTNYGYHRGIPASQFR